MGESLFRRGRLVTTAGVAIDERGRYFLARRGPEGSQALRWEFPGGKCDQDRDEPACLVREFWEELSLPIEVLHEIGTVEFDHKTTQLVLVAYRIRLLSTRYRLHVHVDAAWVSPEDLLDLDLAESDRVLVETCILS